MKQRYNDLTHDLCVRAVLEGLDGKWLRKDIQQVVNKYGGVTYAEIEKDMNASSVNAMLEAAEGIAYELEQRILDLLAGDPEALELEPVVLHTRPDGMTGKLREIADLCVTHQLFGHLVQLGLEPLLKARIEWGQCASIPRRGQTGLKRRVERWLRRKSLGIRCAKKADVRHAYGSLLYNVVTDMLHCEIPHARWILATLEALSANAPGGHLIIGGYLDAWLFNYAMSHAVRYVLELYKARRGQRVPLVIRVVTHMDDFGLLGRRMADVVSATRKLARWMQQHLGLELKLGNEVHFLSYEAEHQRRRAKTPAARGCPALDMGGYKMHRSYTTVRGCIYRRARRAYLRAGREVADSGTVRLCRAYRLGAYYGYYKNTAAQGARRRLNVDKLTALAGHVVSRAERKRRICNAL